MKTCAPCHGKNPPQGLQQTLDLFVSREDLMSKRILEARIPLRLGTHVRIGMTPDLAAATERKVSPRPAYRRADVERTVAGNIQGQ